MTVAVLPAGSGNPEDKLAPPRAGTSGLERLLALEEAARRCATVTELAHVLATDGRQILRAGQIFVFRLRGRRARMVAVSHLSSVDRTAPLVQDLERILADRARSLQDGSRRLSLADLRQGSSQCDDMAFGHFVLAPFRARDGASFGGILAARAEAWSDAEMVLVERLAGCFGHAWAALERPARRLAAPRWNRLILPACVTTVIAAGFVPVPLSALAPAEVIARDPVHVTAPIEGVIRSIEVAPNERVEAGTVLVRFVDTAIRARLEVADRSVEVAQAKQKRLMQAAFADKAARRDLAVASAELDLAVAERDAAANQLERTVVRAERPGLAVYGSRKDWEGRPVAIGERLMQVASPEKVQVRIEMPVKDSLLVKDHARVRVYLDSDPLRPLDGTIVQATYHATQVPGGALAFTLVAALGPGEAPPRIGHRGTAQVFGDDVPLGYYVLRRPLTALRQMVGL